MSDDDGNGFGCFGPAVAVSGIVATLFLGPIDTGRTVYNLAIGDIPVMKQELVDYSRSRMGVRGEDKNQLEINLAFRLGVPYIQGKKVDAQAVSTEVLWDLSEDLAPDWYERWVWPKLNEY